MKLFIVVIFTPFKCNQSLSPILCTVQSPWGNVQREKISSVPTLKGWGGGAKIEIGLMGYQIQFSYYNCLLITRLIDTTMPNCSNLVPRELRLSATWTIPMYMDWLPGYPRCSNYNKCDCCCSCKGRGLLSVGAKPSMVVQNISSLWSGTVQNKLTPTMLMGHSNNDNRLESIRAELIPRVRGWVMPFIR